MKITKNKINLLKDKLTNGIRLDEEQKMGLLLQAISDEPINILIIGDPGTAKTKLLRSINAVVQQSDYASGSVYSALSTVKELALQQVARKNSLLLLDNLQYIKDEGLLMDMMDAGLKVIAACNPKFGRFDPYGTIAEQINVSCVLLNRFDLIFINKDMPNEKNDRIKVRDFLNKEIYQPAMSNDEFFELIESFKKYKPKLSKEAKKEIEDYYVGLRNPHRNMVPISLSQVESIVKLAKAHAMLNHSNTLTKDDAKEAIKILSYCFLKIAVDEETGKIDLDRITSEFSGSERKLIVSFLKIIESIENKLGRIIPIEDLIDEASTQGIDEQKVEDLLNLLKMKGEIFEPKRGFISRI